MLAGEGNAASPTLHSHGPIQAAATSGQPKKMRKAFLVLLADQMSVTGGGCAVSDAEDDLKEQGRRGSPGRGAERR